MSKPLGLFEGFGIELEYMIIDRESLNIRPIADELFKSFAGDYVSDVEDGAITWSNELVNHVVELKTTRPVPSLRQLHLEFHRSLLRVNERLLRWNACLLPTAMHPWMSPTTETLLWSHDNNEIYNAYDRIFGCTGHGWSNLQSMHINFSFATDKEFARLHSAIRLLLPILPALAASSPITDGRLTGFLDSRLVHYQTNQKRIPSIAGSVIPEVVSSQAEYNERILQKIYHDITPFDPDELLREDWLNSRGAITRWGRRTIEIRVLDSQECVQADLALAALISETIRALIDESLVPFGEQSREDEVRLKHIFDTVIKDADRAIIADQDYLRHFGISVQKTTAGELWQHIFTFLATHFPHTPAFSEAKPVNARLLFMGPLARRIRSALSAEPSREEIRRVYEQLANCLQRNELFSPDR